VGWFTPAGPRNAQHWFRVGTVDVTTTVLITAVLAVFFILSAIAPAALTPLYLDTHLVLSGQVWRLVTWPLLNVVDASALFVVIMIAVYWWFGQSLEGLLGRTRYLTFTALVILVPAIVLLAVGAGSGKTIAIAEDGAWFLSSAVMVAYAATYPAARSMFGVPFWIVAAVIVGVNALQLISVRDTFGLLFLLLILAVALIAARSFGLTHVRWIPSVPLPAFMTGHAPDRREEKKRRRATHLEVVRTTDINSILDKIAEQGINSLTRDERERLDEHSRNQRG
jgi:hypothetical protein